ncbi:MAG: hypothetical protein AAGJ28_04790 [Pseudomonadota bacterium]
MDTTGSSTARVPRHGAKADPDEIAGAETLTLMLALVPFGVALWWLIARGLFSMVG